MPGFSAPLFQCRPFVSRRKIWCDLQKNQLDEKMIAQIKIRSRCVPATGSTPTRRLLLHAYKSSAPAGVRLIQPSSDMHETEAAVKTLGQVRCCCCCQLTGATMGQGASRLVVSLH